MATCSSGTLDIDGIPWSYSEVGRGPLLLLFHGTLSGKSVFDVQMRTLESRRRVVAFDWPGHGDSGFDPNGWTVDDLVAAIPRLIDGLDERAAAIGGISQGGAICMRAALHAPERVDALITMSAGPDRPGEKVVATMAALGARLAQGSEAERRAALENLQRDYFHAPGWVEAHPAEAEREMALMLAHPREAMPAVTRIPTTYDSIESRLVEIGSPTLVIWGEHDVRAHWGEPMAQQIPDARLVTIPRAGHHVTLDAPWETATAIASFLDELDARPAVRDTRGHAPRRGSLGEDVIPWFQEEERFSARLKAALAADPRGSRRLARPGFAIRFATATGGGVVLVSGDRSARVAPDTCNADVELAFPPGALDRLATGQLTMAAGLVRGELTAAGPVREMLAVAPILESMLRGQEKSSIAKRTSVPLGEIATGSPRDLPHDELPADMWAFQIAGLHKRLADNQVLSGIELKVPEGAITVVLGPSGTGKSVLLSHLTGVLAPDRGTVKVRGQDLASMSAAQLLAMRRRLGILFQDGALFGSMPVYDNVAFPLRQHTDISEREIERLVRARLREVGLADAAALAPGKLSGGMRKRVAFARALILEPDIVLFDEPDSGLDPVRTSLLCDLIKQSHASHGGTYLCVTHNISVVQELADFVAVLWRGRVIASGTREVVFSSADPFVRQFLAGETVGPLGMD